MPTEEEGLRPLSGKSSCHLRKPEQDSDRGVEVTERTLLPKRRPLLGCRHTLTYLKYRSSDEESVRCLDEKRDTLFLVIILVFSG